MQNYILKKVQMRQNVTNLRSKILFFKIFVYLCSDREYQSGFVSIRPAFS